MSDIKLYPLMIPKYEITDEDGAYLSACAKFCPFLKLRLKSTDKIHGIQCILFEEWLSRIDTDIISCCTCNEYLSSMNGHPIAMSVPIQSHRCTCEDKDQSCSDGYYLRSYK